MKISKSFVALHKQRFKAMTQFVIHENWIALMKWILTSAHADGEGGTIHVKIESNISNFTIGIYVVHDNVRGLRITAFSTEPLIQFRLSEFNPKCDLERFHS